MRFPHLLLLLLSVASLGAAQLEIAKIAEIAEIANMAEGFENAVFRIEDAKSRVSIASVKLSVGDLAAVDGQLVGDYSIRVPLMESKNDHGRIVLPLHVSIAELGEKGGTLTGQSISHKKDTTPNKIVCQVIPQKDQTILLAITTDRRTIEFTSRYEVLTSRRAANFTP